MKTIEADAIVTTERTLIIPLPDSLPPGRHHVIVVFEERPTTKRRGSSLRMTTYPIGLLDDQMPLRREDLYGDR